MTCAPRTSEPRQEGIDVQVVRLTERSQVIENVEFVCARCGLDRGGAVVRSRRWFALGSLPLFPLAESEPTIRCNRCAHVSDLGGLDIPTTTQLARLLDEATVAALTILVWASHGDGGVRHRATAVLADGGMGPEWLDHAVQTLSPGDAHARLTRLRDELTAHGKQGLLHRLATVVNADEPVTCTQHNALVDIGCGLGMAPTHVNGTLAIAADRVSS